MTKKKERSLGPPPWFVQAGTVQSMIINAPEKGIAAHVADYAAQEELSPRMLKRFMQLRDFLEKAYPEKLDRFTDRTPASLIDELEKIHAIDADEAEELADVCIGGEITAATLKEKIKQLQASRTIPETINQRSESKRLSIALENMVLQELRKNPGRFGITTKHQIQNSDDLLIKPDITVYEKELDRRTAIEVKYFSPNTADSVYQQTLCKLQWLRTNRFDEVILCILGSSKDAYAKWDAFFKEWTRQKIVILYF